MRILSAFFHYLLVVTARDGIYDRSLTDALSLSITILEYVEHACSNFQPLCHAVIAVNRFTEFAWPLKHAHIWRHKTVFFVMVVILAASVILEGVPNVYYIMEESTVASSDFAIMELALRVANVVLCSIVAFILNMVTVAMFVAFRKFGKMQTAQKGQDVRLFVHSLFMFLVQACLALQRVVEMTDYYSFVSKNTETTGFGLWLPHWLKVDSTRWLAGDDGCFNGDDPKNADKGQRSCGLLYLAFSGYLWLAGVVSSGELTAYLYLLSGGPFLLLVSSFYTVEPGWAGPGLDAGHENILSIAGSRHLNLSRKTLGNEVLGQPGRVKQARWDGTQRIREVLLYVSSCTARNERYQIANRNAQANRKRDYSAYADQLCVTWWYTLAAITT